MGGKGLMKFAMVGNERVEAAPKKEAVCPLCLEKVISKCGNINIWHLSWKNEFPKEQQEVTIKPHRADIQNKEAVVIELQNSPISIEGIKEREIFYNTMIWLINGETFAKGLNLRKKDKIYTFRWKNPSKAWWNCKKPLYIDLSYKINNLRKQLLEINNGITIHTPIKTQTYNESTGETYYETSGYVDTTKQAVKEIEDNIAVLEISPILLIKKLYNKLPCGGWGVLISKQDFLNKFRGEYNGTTNI